MMKYTGFLIMASAILSAGNMYAQDESRFIPVDTSVKILSEARNNPTANDKEIRLSGIFSEKRNFFRYCYQKTLDVSHDPIEGLYAFYFLKEQEGNIQVYETRRNSYKIRDENQLTKCMIKLINNIEGPDSESEEVYSFSIRFNIR